MSQPTGYTRSEDFSQDETDRLAGRSTVSTAGLDAELDAIAVSINETITALGRIQRDDGELNDLTVDVYHLRASVLALMGSAGFTVHNPVGWLTATVYPARDMVTNGTGTYVSSVAHTSGVFATDLAAGKWALLFDSASFVASAVAFTPGGTVIATTVQAAILEVALEALQKSANLSDVANVVTARTNLSVTSKLESQNQTVVYFDDSGSADALVITPSPAVLTNATGQRWSIKKSASDNTLTNPTLNVSGLGARKIFKSGGTALLPGDLKAGGHYDFEYDATYDSSSGGWELKNPNQLGVASQTVPLFKNRLITGSWRFDQQNEGAAYAVAAGAVVGPDGWTGSATGAGTFTMQRVADPDNASLYALKLACTVADAAIAAGDTYIIYSALEGYDVADLKAGTASASQITISFDCKMGVAGVYPLTIRNSAANRSYVGSFTQNVAGTNESKTVTLTLDLTGTWLYTSGIGMYLIIGLAVGSTLQTAANTWTAGNFVGVNTAMANFMSANTNVGYIKRIQLEKGAVATPFEEVSEQQELARVQRYAEKSYAQGTPVPTSLSTGRRTTGNSVVVAGLNFASDSFKVEKRSAPTLTIYAYNIGTTAFVTQDDLSNVALGTSSVGTSGYDIQWTNGASRYGGLWHFYANSRLS